MCLILKGVDHGGDTYSVDLFLDYNIDLAPTYQVKYGQSSNLVFTGTPTHPLYVHAFLW